MNTKNWILILSVVFIASSCYYDNKEELYQYVQPQDCGEIASATYSADVAPVLLATCNRCHRNGQEDGNVNLEGYSNVKRYADNGSLYGSANHEAGFPIMPPASAKISFCDLERVRIWIEAGAINN